MAGKQLAQPSLAFGGILLLVACNSTGDDYAGDYYDGLEDKSIIDATRYAREEDWGDSQREELEYRATEDWHRLYGEATEVAYDATWQAAYEQGLTD